MNSELLWSLLVKGSVVVCLAGLAALALRRASGARRHVIWLGTIGALLLLPIGAGIRNWTVSTERTRLVAPLVPPAGLQLSASSPGDHLSIGQSDATGGAKLSLGSMIADGWMIGFTLSLAWSIVGLAGVRRLIRRGKEWTPEGDHPGVKVLLCDGLRVPATAGVFRPVILLPIEATTWDADRLRMVIAHESAHITRLDWMWQTVSQVACAVHFYNPLVWLAARRLRAESEIACDDLVLSAGIEPTAYAQELLEIAKKSRFELAGVVGMARTCHVENRLRAIVDGSRRRNRVSARTLLGSLAVAAILITPVATLRASGAKDKTPKEVLEVLANHYKGLSSFDATIAHHNSSGLFPGDYAQVLHWTKPRTFTLKVSKPAVGQERTAGDYTSDGTTVHTVGGGYPEPGQSQPINTDPNVSPGYEVSAGPILSWLLQSPSPDLILNPPKGLTATYAFEAEKDWHGVKAVPIKVGLTFNGETNAMELYVNEKMDQFLGMEWDNRGKPAYLIYTDQKLN